jgi:hypothetical protein
VREKANIKKYKMEEGEGDEVRGRIKNFLLALASINHSATWDGGERGNKKKCPPHSTLKRVKVFFWEKKGRKGEER